MGIEESAARWNSNAPDAPIRIEPGVESTRERSPEEECSCRSQGGTFRIRAERIEDEHRDKSCRGRRRTTEGRTGHDRRGQHAS